MNDPTLLTQMAYQRLLDDIEQQRMLRQVELPNADGQRTYLSAVGNRLIHLGRLCWSWYSTTGCQTYVPNNTIDSDSTG